MPKKPDAVKGESYTLNDKQRSRAQEKLLAAQLAQKDFQTYMEGLMAGVGLDGNENWNLDVNTWTFEKIEKPKEAETVLRG